MRWPLLVMFLAGCSDFELEKVQEKTPEGVKDLLVDPGIVDFGVRPDSAPVTDVVTLTVTGTLPVQISSIELSGSGAYTLTGASEDLTIQPGESTDLVVTYAAQSVSDTAQIVVHSDAVLPAQVVDLIGAGTYPAIAIEPGSVYFQSEYGESVIEQVVVSSVGTADLDLSDMFVQGDAFSAEGPIPAILPPGDSITLTTTYTPVADGETVTGKIWLTTNTPAGFAVVPLEGHEGPVCVGLGEAWDRGELTASTLFDGSTLNVENLSADTDVCIDQWYVWLSEGSQDLGAGDMDGDFGDAYPYGSIGIPAGGNIEFDALHTAGDAWWCMESTQVTARNQDYEFIGARVPEPMLSYMLAGDQDGSWAWQEENPVMIAARRTNYLGFTEAGGSAPVTLRVLNMGGRDGVAEIRETVPAGYRASDFTQAPIGTETDADGGTVYRFAVSLGARETTPIDEDTIYQEQEITYTLTVPGCVGRTAFPPMESVWTDSDQHERVATANPLIVHCE